MPWVSAYGILCFKMWKGERAVQEKNSATKKLLAEGLKKCMYMYSFDRITIKEITDAAGFNRSTFYNHFKDKYDLLEWILQEDIILPVGELFTQEKYQEGVRLVVQRMEENKKFYLRAAKIEGQNSFKEMVYQAFCRLIEEILRKYDGYTTEDMHFLTPSIIAEYYATAETFILFQWLESGMEIPANEIEQVHALLLSFSFEDVMKKITAR